MSIDFTDIFCGAGGSSIGLVAGGLELKLAANHWDRAIETHSANFPNADHLIADVSNYDMRRLPRTQVLWASPECTWHSPAGGRKSEEQIRAQLDLFEDYVPTGGVRSRATAFDVIRAAEVHRYKVIIVENVVEFATRWELFDWWIAGLKNLGYTVQLISVSSAHVGNASNAPAPQWRDRLYVYCTAEGVPVPDVRPRPIAWCPTCEETVAAVQSWRRPNRRHVGKYRQQYDYRCPNMECRYSIIEPFVLPAASIIDWTDLGTRIGDRESVGKKPLVAATLRRIQAGIDLFAEPTMITVNHDDDGRAYPASAGAFSARTTKTGDGLACPPMLVPAGGGWTTPPPPSTTRCAPAPPRHRRRLHLT
jgi:DNA (cytosine-5)-methyltransferase 1